MHAWNVKHWDELYIKNFKFFFDENNPSTFYNSPKYTAHIWRKNVTVLYILKLKNNS